MAARHHLLARILLLGAGLASLVAFGWLPLLSGEAFYRQVAAPAFSLDPRPSGVPAAPGAAAEDLQRLLDLLDDDGQAAAQLTPLGCVRLGRALPAHAAPQAVDQLVLRKMALILQLMGAIFLPFGLLCTLLALYPGPQSLLTMIVAGAAALWLLLSHLFALLFDLMGPMEPFFLWPGHVVTVFLALAAATATALPLHAGNVLRAIIGTLALFLVGSVALVLLIMAA